MLVRLIEDINIKQLLTTVIGYFLARFRHLYLQKKTLCFYSILKLKEAHYSYFVTYLFIDFKVNVRASVNWHLGKGASHNKWVDRFISALQWWSGSRSLSTSSPLLSIWNAFLAATRLIYKPKRLLRELPDVEFLRIPRRRDLLQIRQFAEILLSVSSSQSSSRQFLDSLHKDSAWFYQPICWTEWYTEVFQAQGRDCGAN